MADTPSTAEQAGMSFARRCLKAKSALFLWSLLAKIPVDNELKKEERVRHKNMFFALFSDPLQLGIESLLLDSTKREDILKLVSAMYGDDAVTLALNDIDRSGRTTLRG